MENGIEFLGKEEEKYEIITSESQEWLWGAQTWFDYDIRIHSPAFDKPWRLSAEGCWPGGIDNHGNVYSIQLYVSDPPSYDADEALYDYVRGWTGEKGELRSIMDDLRNYNEGDFRREYEWGMVYISRYVEGVIPYNFYWDDDDPDPAGFLNIDYRDLDRPQAEMEWYSDIPSAFSADDEMKFTEGLLDILYEEGGVTDEIKVEYEFEGEIYKGTAYVWSP